MDERMATGSKRWTRLSATARIVVALAALAPTAPATTVSAEQLAPISVALVGLPTSVASDSGREAGEWERLRRLRIA